MTPSSIIASKMIYYNNMKKKIKGKLSNVSILAVCKGEHTC